MKSGYVASVLCAPPACFYSSAAEGEKTAEEEVTEEAVSENDVAEDSNGGDGHDGV